MPTIRRAVWTTISQTKRVRLATVSVIATCQRALWIDLDHGAVLVAQRLADLDKAKDHDGHNDRREQTCQGGVDMVVEHDPAHLLHGPGRRQNASLGGGISEAARVTEEAD